MGARRGRRRRYVSDSAGWAAVQPCDVHEHPTFRSCTQWLVTGALLADPVAWAIYMTLYYGMSECMPSSDVPVQATFAAAAAAVEP